MKGLRNFFLRGPEHLLTGLRGEKQAERFLRRKRYKIIGRRVRIGRHGEIDLIARDGETLVFIEVKTRSGEAFGRPASAVGSKKRRCLSHAAVQFLKQRKLCPDYIRFDIVEVIGNPPEIRHLENAFTLEGGYRIWW